MLEIDKFLDIIHAIFKASNISLLHKNKVTEPLYTTIGLKQGDILSAIYFNLFIIPSFLAMEIIRNDLAIFSSSRKELQNKIYILDEYCCNWGLELSIIKTKIIIFN